jgi:Diguanylate cyclase, GGDEF domain
MTDALTGISNRRKLKLDLEEGLRSASPAEPLRLMLFDLNGFKAYNDTFGHPAGDALLVRLATARKQAMAGHGGGSPSPPPTGRSCCPRRARTSPRPCSWSTSACTPRRPAAAARPTARAATCVVDAFSELVVELAWPTAPAPSEVSGGAR